MSKPSSRNRAVPVPPVSSGPVAWGREFGEGVHLSIRVQPRAARSECVGLYGEGDAIKLRIAAPPIDGAANDELIRYLAERLGVTKRQVEVRVGEASRGKQVVVQGVTLAQVKERLGV